MSRWKFAAENGYWTIGPPPLATSQTSAIASVRHRPRQVVVRHGGDVPAVRAERQACRRHVGEPRQRRADDLERRHVDEVELEGATRPSLPVKDDITARRPSGLTALETLGSGLAMDASRRAGRDVVLAQARRSPNPLASRVLPSGVNPRSRKASVSLRMTAMASGLRWMVASRFDAGLRRVLEVSAFHREQQSLVVVVDHQCLRAEPAGLGQFRGRVGLGGVGLGPFALLDGDEPGDQRGDGEQGDANERAAESTVLVGVALGRGLPGRPVRSRRGRPMHRGTPLRCR